MRRADPIDKPDWATREEYDPYVISYNKRTDVVKAMADAGLSRGRYLYHATDREIALLIKESGLKPREPGWTSTLEASKDGLLSFATRSSGADAMVKRGVAVLLRIALRSEDLALDPDDGGERDPFKRASATEVITAKSFPPERIKWRWKPHTKTAFKALSTFKKTWYP